MLAGLGHRAVGGGNHKNATVHLGGAGDHVFHIVSMPGAVHVSVVALEGLIFHVRGVDCNTALTFFGGGIDVSVAFLLSEALFSQRVGDRRGERGFAVVNVTDSANVYVRLGALE